MFKLHHLLLSLVVGVVACSPVNAPLENAEENQPAKAQQTSSSGTQENSSTSESDAKTGSAAQEEAAEDSSAEESSEKESEELKATVVGITVGDYPSEMTAGGEAYKPQAEVEWSDGKKTTAFTFSVIDSEILRREGDRIYAQRPGSTEVVFRSLHNPGIQESVTIKVVGETNQPGPDPLFPVTLPNSTALKLLNNYYLDYREGMSWEYTIRYAGTRFSFADKTLPLPETISLSKGMVVTGASYEDIHDRVDQIFVAPNQNMGTYRVTVQAVYADSVLIQTELRSNSAYIASQAPQSAYYYYFDIGEVFDGVLEDAVVSHSLGETTEPVAIMAQYQSPPVEISTRQYVSTSAAVTNRPSTNKEVIAYYMDPNLGVIKKVLQMHREYSQLSLDSQVVMDLTSYTSGSEPVLIPELGESAMP